MTDVIHFTGQMRLKHSEGNTQRFGFRDVHVLPTGWVRAEYGEDGAIELFPSHVIRRIELDQGGEW